MATVTQMSTFSEISSSGNNQFSLSTKLNSDRLSGGGVFIVRIEWGPLEPQEEHILQI